MDELNRRALLSAAGLVSVGAIARSAHAGPLNPPAGNVAGTGRTLQEVYDRIPSGLGEGRTVIAGLTGNISILAPGVYVLAGNIDAIGTALQINVSSGTVTLDLNGFRVTTADALLPCISASGPQVVIRNGTIQGGFFGVQLSNAPGAVLENLRIVRPKSVGINITGSTSRGCTVRRCTVIDAGFSTSASDTNPVVGIQANTVAACRIEDCTVAGLIHNGTSPGQRVGINAQSDGGYVSGCMVHNTTSQVGSVGIDGVSTMVYRNCNVRNFPTRYGTGTDGGGNF